MQSRPKKSGQWVIKAMCADGMIIVCFKQSCGAFELDSSESLQGILPQINPKLGLCTGSSRVPGLHTGNFGTAVQAFTWGLCTVNITGAFGLS